jgi:Cys-rich repeat protein
MRLSRLVLLVLVCLPLVGCDSGGECDECSTDGDCKSGFVCSTFSDGSKRWGSGAGATTCKVR